MTVPPSSPNSDSIQRAGEYAERGVMPNSAPYRPHCRFHFFAIRVVQTTSGDSFSARSNRSPLNVPACGWMYRGNDGQRHCMTSFT